MAGAWAIEENEGASGVGVVRRFLLSLLLSHFVAAVLFRLVSRGRIGTKKLQPGDAIWYEGKTCIW